VCLGLAGAAYKGRGSYSVGWFEVVYTTSILHRCVRGFGNSLVRVTLRVWLLLAFSCAQGLPSQLFVMVSTTGLYSVQWGLFCPKRLFVPSRCVVDAVFGLRALFSWLHVPICSDSR